MKNRYLLPALTVAALLAGTVTVTAQAPFPGAVRVGDNWVPCDHQLALDAGLSCAAPTPAAAPVATEAHRAISPGLIDPSKVTCPASFDPYTATYAELVVCMKLAPKPTNPWTGEPFSYEVGVAYRMIYGNDTRFVVISVVAEQLTGRLIVTGKIFETGREPRLQVGYEDSLGGNWVPLRPGQVR